MAPLRGLSLDDYNPGQMTYDLRRLRLRGLIERIPHTQRYRLTAEGLCVAEREELTETGLGVDRKMLWSLAASSSQQRARVLTDVKARRFAPPPLRGADGLDAGSAHARPDWLLSTMLTHTPSTCCGRRPVQNDALSGDR